MSNPGVPYGGANQSPSNQQLYMSRLQTSRNMPLNFQDFNIAGPASNEHPSFSRLLSNDFGFKYTKMEIDRKNLIPEQQASQGYS